MSYINLEFPVCLAMGAVGGPVWKTAVAENEGGFEQRDQAWSRSKQSYDVSTAVRSIDEYRLALDHFNQVRGRLHSFPFKDFLDYEVQGAEGVVVYVEPGVYQLAKRYGSSNPYYRKITRPVDAVVNAGALDPSTGRVTVDPDQTRTVSAHTVGSQHEVTLASALSPNAIPGGTVFLSGVTGTAAEKLNGKPLAVMTVSDEVLTLDVDTTGLTASGGTVAVYPATEEITWTGEFRVPVRYADDRLPGQVVNSNGQDLFVQASSIILIEVRE